jgi:hypothetical protein
MGALRAGLDAALAGRGALGVVSGEPGIGKSAVVTAIGREAETRGAVVTWGRAWEFADAPPYFPVRGCLRTLGIDARSSAGAQRNEQDVFELWEAVLPALALAAEKTPVVWILEDIHAADLGTLDLLTFLAQPLKAIRALVIATVRNADPRLTDRMLQRLTRIRRDGIDVRLEPLCRADVAAITEGAVGRTIPEKELAKLMDLTGGNPLFVLECARAFRAAGGLEGTLGALPPTVRQLALDRAELLPESTRRALSCAAILGREFSASTVARMSSCLPARVIDDLLPALRSGLVEEIRPGEFRFSHMLVRDAVEDAMPREQRCVLHARADEALAPLGEGADVLVERARHVLLALPTTSNEHATDLVRRARRLLESDAAFDRAFELGVKVEAARSAGLLPTATLDEKLHEAHIARAAGRADVSKRLCYEVVAEARAAADAEHFARATLLILAEIRPGVIDAREIALLEEARTMLGADTGPLSSLVRARLSAALLPATDASLPLRLAHEAIAGARATKDDALLREVLDMTSWACFFYSPLEEHLVLSVELVERSLAAGDLPRAVRAYGRLATDHIELGDVEAFERDVESMLALSDRLGHPRHRWQSLLLASARATARGHFAESDRWVTEVKELVPLADDPGLALSLATHDAHRARNQRREDEQAVAIARLDEVLEGAWHGKTFVALFRAAAAARMEDAARARDALAVVGASAAMFESDRSAVAWLAEAYALVGSDEERRRIRELLLRDRRQDVAEGLAASYEGPVGRLVGLLDASLGDLTTAEVRLREAHALALRRRHTPWVAQIGWELAKVLRQAGREPEARRLADEAVSIARELGMTGLVRNAGGEASAAEPLAHPPLVVTMKREGASWRVSRGATSAMVKDSRGMQLLAQLVERPDEEVHVLALASDDGTAVPESSAGELLDETARLAYKRRLAQLDEDLEAAERESHSTSEQSERGVANAARLAKHRREKEAILAELARAVGLGGRTRQAGSATERARINVQRRLKDAIARIGEAEIGLGRFFEKAVRTGTYCTFRP